MKVAIDASPSTSGHSVRGIGSYTNKLIESLKKIRDLELELFNNNSNIPQADLTHYPYFDLFFHTLPIFKKQKRVVTIHDLIPLVFPNHFPVGIKGYINFFFQKRALKNTDFVICDSQTSKDDIADKLSFPKEKIFIVNLAASDNFKKVDDKNKLSQVSQKFKLPKEFALYVGDVNWNKNITGLINSIKISQVPIVMVGAAIINDQIPQTAELNNLIKKLKLQEKIIKTGYVEEEELSVLYNLASLTLLPSFYEGFGLPVLESMACGTPVVCSNNSSLSEISGGYAHYCEPQDYNDIAKKTLTILNMQKDKKEKLSQELIKYSQSFSWEKTARETLKVYKKII